MLLVMRRAPRAALSLGLATGLVLASATCSNAVARSTTGPAGGSGGSCSSGPPPGGTPPPGQPDVITIAGVQPPSCQLSCLAGTGIPVLAVVKDVNGTVLENQTVTWVSSNTNVVSVTGRGLSNSGYVGSVDCNSQGQASISAIDSALEVTVTVISQ